MRLKLDARDWAILRRLPAVSVYSLAELLLLALLAIQAARLVWTIVTPVSPLGDWRPAVPVAPAVTASTFRDFDPFFPDGADAPAQVTSLSLKLFGVRVDEATGRGSAIIAGADGVQKSVAVGESVAPGVTLKAVAFDHVTLANGGGTEDLFLDQSGASAAPAPQAVSLAGAVPVAVADDTAPAGVTMAQLRAEIAVIPRIDGGRISGLVVRPQGAGAAFRTAGLRTGDVITALGGRPVTGPDDLARVGREFAAGGRLTMTVERGGATLPLSIAVAAPR